MAASSPVSTHAPLSGQDRREVLKQGDVQLDDNLIELGADSLDAIEAFRLVQERTQVELTIDDFFDFETLQDMADVLQAKLTARQDEPAPAATDGEDGAAANYFCAYDLPMDDDKITVSLTRDDYERDGVPPEAMNFRLL